MISNGEKQWHYLAVKKLSALLRGINHGDFYCLNCFHSFATESKPESHKKASENKDFCNENMLSVKILEFNWYQKSEKAPFIFYTGLEFIIETIDGCKSNPTSTAKAS